ncbi:MAG: CRISPR-associated helicase Cas3' [Methanobacteriaceae archaeon]|jgi:CRISPR-associated endonuclease/helicase Cas3
MSSSFDLKSHPKKALEAHLTNVANFSRNVILEKQMENKNIYAEIAFSIGLSHDFAKSTTYFQNYLFDHKRTERAYHGLLSAIFGYYSADECLKNNNLDGFWYLAPIAWLVILRHHGNIKNIMGTEGESAKLKDLNIVKKQIEDVQENNLTHVNEIYQKFDVNVEKFFDEFENIVSKIRKDLRKLTRERGIKNYFLILLFYSVLLDADKMDASETEIPKRIDIPENMVDTFKKLKFGSDFDGINKIREDAYQETVNSLNGMNLEKDRILSLNLPTGCGKTLSGLSFTLKLRKKVQEELGFLPRIIYSLPFLSIIDQNADVFSDIIMNEWELRKLFDKNKEQNVRIPSNLLLKHHHLAEVSYKTIDELEIDVGRSQLLIEGWYSEIVITTFIQFFYSLITNKNRSARKFHNMINSIIILDEIQAIPHDYWKLLNLTLKYLCETFNCWAILMTATEPLIFKENNEIKSIIKDKEKYFKEFDRINYNFNLESEDFEDFKEKLWKNIISEPEKDIMVVLNTINASQELYSHIKKKFVKESQLERDEIGIAHFGNTDLINLSTLIIPDHRLKRIKSIKNSNKRKIIITTQLIEAGVDISVNIVYRDMAPLDSIVQTAGRCNRNSEKEKGTVEIVNLIDQTGKNFYSYIYSSTLIGATVDVINGNISVKENEFNDFSVPQYYNFALDRGSQDKANDIISCIEKLKFSSLRKFKLIEEQHEKIDVFIGINEKAERIWEKYKKISEIENRLERKNEFLKIKPDFYNYVISVDANKLGKIVMDTEWLGYLGFNDLDRKYDIETGFIPLNKEEPFII